MATKDNPGKYDCYAKAAADEPLFTLRAKDPVADSFVAAWVAIRAGDLEDAKRMMERAAKELADSGRTLLPRESDKSLEANQCAKAMYEWRLNQRITACEQRLGEVK